MGFMIWWASQGRWGMGNRMRASKPVTRYLPRSVKWIKMESSFKVKVILYFYQKWKTSHQSEKRVNALCCSWKCGNTRATIFYVASTGGMGPLLPLNGGIFRHMKSGLKKKRKEILWIVIIEMWGKWKK